MPALASASAAPTSTADNSLATFEGRTIDLREGWGEARACSIGHEQSICFRSEQTTASSRCAAMMAASRRLRLTAFDDSDDVAEARDVLDAVLVDDRDDAKSGSRRGRG